MQSLKLALAIVLSSAAFVRAQGPIKWGDADVTPRAAIEEKYDDNIFLQPSAKRDSQVVMLMLGSSVVERGARGKLALDYELSLLHYDRFTDVNDAIHQKVDGSAAYELANGGKVSVGNVFLMTTDPASSEQTARAARNQNDTTGRVELPLGARTFVGLSARNTIHVYTQDPLRSELDRNELSGGPRLGYNLGDKTKTYVQYQYSTITYDRSGTKNSVTHAVAVGAEGELTGRLTGVVEAGALRRSYSSSIPGDVNNETTPSAVARVKWAAPRGYAVSLSVSRRFEESTFNRYYRSNLAGVVVAKELGSRMSASVSGSYGYDEYPDDALDGTTGQSGKRADHLAQAGVNLTYRFPELLRLNVGYLHRNRDSNFDTFDYSDNVGTFSIGMEF